MLLQAAGVRPAGGFSFFTKAMKLIVTFLFTATLAANVANANGSDPKHSAKKWTPAEKELQSSLGKSEKLRVGDLPQVVRQTLQREVGDATPTSIKTKMRDGRTIYKIEVKKENRRRVLKIDDAGNMID